MIENRARSCCFVLIIAGLRGLDVSFPLSDTVQTEQLEPDWHCDVSIVGRSLQSQDLIYYNIVLSSRHPPLSKSGIYERKRNCHMVYLSFPLPVLLMAIDHGQFAAFLCYSFCSSPLLLHVVLWQKTLERCATMHEKSSENKL